ncbi:hypothetical protein LPB140_09035 [Sphingorhabdus lutea]|uniref:YlxR domain-containing protein n=2 Tax=Sphingorhabdus lutea TaxID=1913578 RepID=A0A1L3JCR2_9SPHN|nr:hypothetical protein LPB140_09035 [Sphingorhabdus lutea]
MNDDGQIFPDIHAKAPGRGCWVGVDKQKLAIAANDGKLKSALCRAFKRNDISFDANIADHIDDGMRGQFLNRLGLESRAGNLLTGSERIAESGRAGKVFLLLHAQDAAEDGRRKLDQAWRVGTGQEGQGLQGAIIPTSRDNISAALGRGNAVHVAIINKKAAVRIWQISARWLKYSGCPIQQQNIFADLLNSGKEKKIEKQRISLFHE